MLVKTVTSTARHSEYLCDTTPSKANGEEVHVLSCHSRAHRPRRAILRGVIWPLVEKL